MRLLESPCGNLFSEPHIHEHLQIPRIHHHVLIALAAIHLVLITIIFVLVLRFILIICVCPPRVHSVLALSLRFHI